MDVNQLDVSFVAIDAVQRYHDTTNVGVVVTKGLQAFQMTGLSFLFGVHQIRK